MARHLLTAVSLAAASISPVAQARVAGGAAHPSRAASIPARSLQPAQLRSDLAALRAALERAHAAPYRYISKAELDASLDAVSRRVDRPMTDLDFYRLLALIIASIRNSHTGIQAPADALRAMRAYPTVFPLILRWQDGRALVERNLGGDPAIRQGMEVVAINGRPMTEVSRDLMASRATEGFGEAAKLARLHQNLWLDLMLRYGPSDRFGISYTDASPGRVREADVGGVPAELVQASTPQFPSAEGPAQSLRIERESGVATMRIGNLLEPDTPAFLRDAFHRIAEARVGNLIIDLRGNHGGVDWFNSELLSYLRDAPFRFYRARDYRVRSYDVLKGMTYGIYDFLLLEQVALLPSAARARPFDGMTLPELLDFTLATDHAGGTQTPKRQDRFQGRVYLLVDGMSGSSAAELPALMHHLGLATIIGEEANGSYQGEVAGITPTLTLPNSKLGVRVPLLAYHNAVLPGVREGRGPEPTFVVPETVADAAAGIDTAMTFTRALIASRKPAS